MPQPAKLISNNFLLVLCIVFVNIASAKTIGEKVTHAATGKPWDEFDGSGNLHY